MAARHEGITGARSSAMLSPLFYWTATRFVDISFLAPRFNVRVTGLENVPREGPLLIVANHQSNYDPWLICSRIPRRIAFMAKAELYRSRASSWFLNSYGSIPVNRTRPDLSALRLSRQALKSGLAVGVFPEGTRISEPGRLGDGKPGAAILALRDEIPILPIAIARTRAPDETSSLPRRLQILLNIGPTFYLRSAGKLDETSVRIGTREIMRAIAELLPGTASYPLEAEVP